jgi:plastocyanin
MRIGIPALLIAIVLVGSVALLATRPARGTGDAAAAPTGHAMSMPMGDAEMAAMAKQYWSTHARVAPTSSVPATVNAVADTFLTNNFIFDADHNAGTQLDTVRVALNDGVLFLWQGGTHTATSGTGSADPNAGVIFNVPLDSFAGDHTFMFSSAVAETVPFFCSFHELFNMKGTIIVFDPLTGVGGTPVGAGIGFASHPRPNPTGGRVNFRYSLKQAGRVHAEVLDVSGRRVATVLDLVRTPGTFDAVWDGRLASGRTAPTGRYFLYLSVPGAVGSQAITLMR